MTYTLYIYIIRITYTFENNCRLYICIGTKYAACTL